TTIAAIKLLGMDYRFNTSFYYDGEIKAGTLNGNIYIKGGGDPTIYLETMYTIAKKIKKYGINNINGNIYGDESFFDTDYYPIGWNKAEDGEPYLALISALSFNFNAIDFSVVPTEKNKVTVSTDPPIPTIKIINQIKASPTEKTWITIKHSFTNNKDTYLLEGTYNTKHKPRTYYFTVKAPSTFFLNSLKGYLKSVGVYLHGALEMKKVPDNASLLFEHKSKELSQILRDMNKYSSNFIANQLVKTIAATTLKKPGTFKEGADLIFDYFAKNKFKTEGIKIIDGSGLSYDNRMTTQFIAELLEFAYNDLRIYPEIVYSLSIMGVDGSVKKWDLRDEHYGRVRVKTGTLAKAVSLSGYTQLKDGKEVVFAMIFNNFNCCIYKIREIEKKIIQSLLNP
ncbi:MAG: D-alanyl-D-alanine carboxypeptidase/D-alanyl-D-alanine-endopeptidase, partial [Nitrospinae bacterium]|nr:D-alanyl-D-alanine carboxypeptidase/D-alanyl-D-alanine-endopeptidase [Nitrospinota bacterium]